MSPHVLFQGKAGLIALFRVSKTQKSEVLDFQAFPSKGESGWQFHLKREKRLFDPWCVLCSRGISFLLIFHPVAFIHDAEHMPLPGRLSSLGGEAGNISKKGQSEAKAAVVFNLHSMEL